MVNSGAISIETRRLLLRPMEISDIDAMLCIFTDPPVIASFGIPPFERRQMKQWVQRNLSHQNEFGYGLFSVILKHSNSLIGDCGLEHRDIDGEMVTELGYDFLSRYWHRGLATEAARAVRDYAFMKLTLPHLVSLIRVGNDASKRVAERIGMTFISELTHHGNRYWRYGIERVHRCG
jgi:ribosomal-protein-alanine N-acetyltransferase